MQKNIINKKPQKQNDYAHFAKASSMGMHFISGLLVGGAMGYGLDYLFGSKPIFFIIFLFLGLISGFWNVYLDTKLLIKQMEKTNRD